MHLREFEGWIDYVPEWRGNRDGPEPMVVAIKPFSAGERRRFQLQHSTAMRKGGAAAERRADELLDGILSDRVGAIQGLKLFRHLADGEVTEESVVNGEQLKEYAPEPLRLELFEAIASGVRLDEGIKKK